MGDLVCILEHSKVKSAICIGCGSYFVEIEYFISNEKRTSLRHDWGAQICYEAARMRPDIFKAVAGLVIPVSFLFFCNFHSSPRNLIPFTVYSFCRSFYPHRRTRHHLPCPLLSGVLRGPHGCGHRRA